MNSFATRCRESRDCADRDRSVAERNFCKTGHRVTVSEQHRILWTESDNHWLCLAIQAANLKGFTVYVVRQRHCQRVPSRTSLRILCPLRANSKVFYNLSMKLSLRLDCLDIESKKTKPDIATARFAGAQQCHNLRHKACLCLFRRH